MRRGYRAGRQHNRFPDGPEEREANKYMVERWEYGKVEADRRAANRRLFKSLPQEQQDELNELSRQVSDLEQQWKRSRDMLARRMLLLGFMEEGL